MSKYERQWVDVGSLQDGDAFELPWRRNTVMRVTYCNLIEDDEGRVFRIIGYDILEGGLHWPVIYLPLEYQVVLLLPTTTYVQLSGKDWVNTLTEHHGVTNNG